MDYQSCQNGMDSSTLRFLLFWAACPDYDLVVSSASKPHNVRIANSPRQTTFATIKQGRGILKRKPGDKPFAEQWAEHKREESQLKEAKYTRCTDSDSRKPLSG